ncbi:hypothetical protein AAFF_G00171580 [Aldrovandia affinis]|uniref:Uncharacterized protein n=1 Tax=Aldrovandia affinis TaxID=143900 RepID=A0AAD7SYJ0_9TELE|nr:hypothetical protein AAFF_G00171580 [Aldrovandia affinis]
MSTHSKAKQTCVQCQAYEGRTLEDLARVAEAQRVSRNHFVSDVPGAIAAIDADHDSPTTYLTARLVERRQMLSSIRQDDCQETEP